MLVVTGTQRSGTSVVAKMYATKNRVSTNWWDEKVDGGMESTTVCQFYRDYLGMEDFPYRGMPGLHNPGRPCVNCFKGLHYKYDVVKFSYLLASPVFVSVWHRFRPPELGDKFLIMKRDFGDVIRSKENHPEFKKDCSLLKQKESQLRANYFTSLGEILKYEYYVRIVNFEQLQADPGLELSKVDCRYEADTSIFDFSKIHF